MEVKEYIESGILEAYVLDALTPEERLGVQENIALYPEIAAEVKSIEESLLAVAQHGAEEPPVFLKEQIWDAIVQEQAGSVQNVTSKTMPDAQPTRTRPLPPAPQPRQVSWQRAAMWAAFIVSILTNFILLSQRNASRQQQVAVNRQVDSLKQQQQTLTLVVDNYRKEKDMLADTGMQAILMKTAQPGQAMAATVYWNKSNGETYLAMQKLPMPPTGKQYQMWVIQDGKPVSMGVIPNDMVATGKVTRLPMHVAEGQAFAISLEPEGGNPTPTQVQVLGKV